MPERLVKRLVAQELTLSFVPDVTQRLWRTVTRRTLDELEVMDTHVRQLDEELARLLRLHQDAVERLAAVPGLGVDSEQQIIAEVGPTAATFSTAKRLASWVGACPGHDESAGINHRHRSPNGNRQMRRLLNQAANAAVKTKGSIFELVYRRMVVRLGHAQPRADTMKKVIGPGSRRPSSSLSS
jgi:transposase